MVQKPITDQIINQFLTDITKQSLLDTTQLEGLRTILKDEKSNKAAILKAIESVPKNENH